jgi:hypothetical protein
VARLVAQRRGAGEEHLLEDSRPIAVDTFLFVAIAIELGHALEQVPQKEQALRRIIGVHAQNFDNACHVEMPQLDVIRRAVEQRRAPVFEQGGHLGMERAQHDQPTGDFLRLGGELIHHALKVGSELEELLAMEVLELVQGHDVAPANQNPDGLGQALQVGRLWVGHSEGTEEIAGGRDHADRVRVWNLDVHHAIAPARFEGLPDQGGLTDAPAPGYLEEEPAAPAQDRRQVRQLLHPTTARLRCFPIVPAVWGPPQPNALSSAIPPQLYTHSKQVMRGNGIESPGFSSRPR